MGQTGKGGKGFREEKGEDLGGKRPWGGNGGKDLNKER